MITKKSGLDFSEIFLNFDEDMGQQISCEKMKRFCFEKIFFWRNRSSVRNDESTSLVGRYTQSVGTGSSDLKYEENVRGNDEEGFQEDEQLEGENFKSLYKAHEQLKTKFHEQEVKIRLFENLKILNHEIEDSRYNAISIKNRIFSLKERKVHFSVSFKDFAFQKDKKKGGYGEVFFCERNGLKFALKRIKKGRVSSRRILEEKRRLGSLSSHPLVVEFYFAFEDEKYVYFAMEPLTGGTLSDFVGCWKKKLSLKDVKIFAAELVEVIGFVHSKGVKYRDLKCDNLCLDDKNHIRLIDFGLSRDCVDVSLSFVGTRSKIIIFPFKFNKGCMAPEMLRKKGHDKCVDYWGIGVVVYEMLYGVVPHLGLDERETQERILKNDVKIPLFPDIGKESVDFIKRLLKKNPKNRLGAKGVEEVKSHRFFLGMDWKKVKEKRYSVDLSP